MKKIILILMMGLIMGCVGLETKQEVSPSNIFTDSKSGTALKIDDGFEYKGTFSNSNVLYPSNTDGRLRQNSNYYAWEKGTSYVLILFKTLTDEGAYWNRVIAPNKIWSIEIKKEKLGGKKWVTGFQNIKLNKWELAEVNKLGVYPPKGRYVTKAWVRNSKTQTKIRIYYFEKKNMNTKEIKERAYLTDAERAFINEFEGRANKAITFIK